MAVPDRMHIYLSSLGLVVEEGTDVSKAEDNASSDCLTGVSTAEQPIGVSKHPAYV